MAHGTTAIWRLLATSHILLHILETSLQLYSAVLYMTSQYDAGTDTTPPLQGVGYIMLGTLAVSSCITNAVSAWMTYRGQDFTSQRPGGALCTILHLLQLGPVWRYFKLIIVGDWTDMQEMFRLRVLQVALQNPIYIVLQGRLLLGGLPTAHIVQLTLGVVVTFMSIVFCYVCSSHTAGSSLTLVTNFNSKPQSISSRVCGWTACSALRLLMFILRHTFMLSSRLLAILLLAHVWKAWVILAAAIHLIVFYVLYLLWSVIHNNIGHASIVKRLPDILLFGYVEMFDYIGQLYQFQHSVLIYYAVVLLENSAMGLVWYFSHNKLFFNDALLVLVFTFFILGVTTGVLSEGALCYKQRPALHDEYKEENNNHNSLASNESHQHVPNTVAPVDFDMDLNDILFASTKYNPNVVSDDVMLVLSIEGSSIQPEPQLPIVIETVTSNSISRSEALLQEVQTSSDSGFVSRLLDTSLSLGIDSEGYSRGTSTPSLTNSTICGTDAKDNSTINVPLSKSAVPLGKDKTLLQNSISTLHKSTLVRTNQNNISMPHLSITSKLTRGKSASTSMVHRTGHKSLDTRPCHSDDTSEPRSSSSGSRSSYKQGKVRLAYRKRAFSRSRSVPHGPRRHSQIQKRHFYSGTTGSFSGKVPQTHRKHAKQLPPPDLFYHSYSSDTTSDSLYDTYQRRYNSTTSSSSSSNSQSLGDCEYELACTWPPGQKCSIVNIYNLPLGQISVNEHVLKWLNRIIISDGTNSENTITHLKAHGLSDVNLEYVNSSKDVTHMSDSGVIRGHLTYVNHRPRTLSESGISYRNHNSRTVCGFRIPGKRKWFDRKILNRLSSLKGRKPKMIIVNRECVTDYKPNLHGLESAV